MNGQRTFRQPKRKKALKRRASPAKILLTIFICAVLTLALVFVGLIAFGFRISAKTVTQHSGQEVRISFIGFVTDGRATSGSISNSLGIKGTVADGKIVYSDGSEYTGSLDGYIRSGTGTLTYANGDVYTGEWKNDEIHGQGRFEYYSSTDVYEGYIEGGKKSGFGKYTYKSLTQSPNTIYEGNYQNDLPNGQGKLTFYDGSVYEGNFTNGTRQGQGKHTFANGDVYEGEILNGRAHGQGKYTFACGDVYEGQFEHGVIHGQGKYTWASGRDYTGLFKNGVAVYTDKTEQTPAETPEENEN